MPPAGTVAFVGLTVRPKPAPTVTTAALDVTEPLVVVVVDEDCWATAVMLTWPTCRPPLAVVGTFDGAVYTPIN